MMILCILHAGLFAAAYVFHVIAEAQDALADSVWGDAKAISLIAFFLGWPLVAWRVFRDLGSTQSHLKWIAVGYVLASGLYVLWALQSLLRFIYPGGIFFTIG